MTTQRISLFDSPLFLGFDQFERTLDRIKKTAHEGYPPYNIEQIGEDGLRITPPEQMAVIAFAERLPQLSAERQQELADIAQPLTGERGPMGVVRLAGIANWLLGR